MTLAQLSEALAGQHRSVLALFDYHWNDHAGQLAKIRPAVGPPATIPVSASSRVPI
jgi:hypothetical protein